MEQGVRLAYGSKRYRVVTLEGQLIDLSGTMSGGGRAATKGGMSSAESTVSASELNAMKQDLETSIVTMNRIRTDLDSANVRMGQINESLRTFEGLIPRLEMEITSLTSQKGTISARLQELSSKKQV